MKQEQRLQKAINISNNIRDYAGEFHKPEEELVQEPELLESAKHYRTKKVLPLVRKMKEKIQGVYLAYIEIKKKLEDMQYRYDRLEQSNEYLVEEKKRLLAENGQLHERIQDLWWLKKGLGNSVIEKIILQEKQKAEIQEKENQKKLQNKKAAKRNIDYGAR